MAIVRIPGNLAYSSRITLLVSSTDSQVFRSMIIFMLSFKHSATKSSRSGTATWPGNSDPSGCFVARSSFLRLVCEMEAILPTPVVIRSTSSSWKTTGLMQDVKLTSNSTNLAPLRWANLRASRLFSGASRQAARWATSQSTQQIMKYRYRTKKMLAGIFLLPSDLNTL